MNDGAKPSSSVAGPTSGTEGQGESVTSGEPSPSVLTSYLFVLFYFLIVGSLITEFGMRNRKRVSKDLIHRFTVLPIGNMYARLAICDILTVGVVKFFVKTVEI